MRFTALDPLTRVGERPHTRVRGIRRNGVEWDGSPDGDIRYLPPISTRAGFSYTLKDSEAEQLRLAMLRAGMIEE